MRAGKLGSCAVTLTKIYPAHSVILSPLANRYTANTYRLVQQFLDTLLCRFSILGTAQYVHATDTDAQTFLEEKRTKEAGRTGDEDALALHEPRYGRIVALTVIKHVLGADVDAAGNGAMHQARITKLQHHIGCGFVYVIVGTECCCTGEGYVWNALNSIDVRPIDDRRHIVLQLGNVIQLIINTRQAV